MKKEQILVHTALGLALILGISCKNDDSEVVDSPGEPQLIATGSRFNGINGLYFRENDNQIYAASAIGSEIGVIDVASGEVLFSLTQEDGVEGPDDLVIDPQGDLYWTAIFSGEVGKLTSGGVLTKQFVAPGVNPITFNDDGRLFVALDFLGDGLYEIDPSLSKTPQLLTDSPLGYLNGMDFGPGGWLYGPIWTQGKVVKINIETLEIVDVVTGFATAPAVKFDANGNLYVLDYIPGEVYTVNINTNEKTLLTQDDRLIGLDNLAFNSLGELYVSNAYNGSIYSIDTENGDVTPILDGDFMYAGDIALESNGDLLLGDVFSLKRSGAEIETVERHFLGQPGMIMPMTIDRSGDNLILSSWFNNAVQVWNYESGTEVELYYDYVLPVNAIFGHDGSLIVAELGFDGAVKISVQKDGVRTNLVESGDGILVPSGLACSAKGDLYVADNYLGTVHKLMSAGEALDEPELIISDLMQPEGMKVTENGKLIIAETGLDRVISVDLTTLELNEVAEIMLGKPGPSGTPPFWLLSDIDIDDEGNLFVTSDVENKIYKITNVH